jgi:methylenetetrahydrofolate dehydrogenase (NADP+)/methenyltetrahydrofolate cyclohydrolase
MRRLDRLNIPGNGIHALLVQLPLPKDEFSELTVFKNISMDKDVDVLNPYNVGLLAHAHPPFLPCTPHAIQIMLKESGVSTKGKHIVIINRSHIVGRPLSSMLIQDNDFGNASVSILHDNTPASELPKFVKSADIVVVAVGIPGFLKADMVREGQIILDVGTTKNGKKILGDVDPAVYNIVSKYSLPKGGVGPLTVYCLLENTFIAAKKFAGLYN